MKLDNFSKLKDVMVFKEGTYYKFVALLRAKDKSDSPIVLEKGECILRQWLVETQEHFDKVVEDMKYTVKLYGCRLYMATDRKSSVKTMVNMRDKINEHLTHSLYNHNAPVSTKMLNKLLASSSSLAESSDGEKRWMYDVDTKDMETVNAVVEQCKEHYLTTMETKNGYHIVANKKYDANRVLSESSVTEVEVKSNSLVLVAMNY